MPISLSLPPSPLSRPPITAIDLATVQRSPAVYSNSTKDCDSLDCPEGPWRKRLWSLECPEEPPSKPLRSQVETLCVIPIERRHAPELTLRLSLGYRQMETKLAALPRADTIETEQQDLWCTLAVMYEGMAKKLFWPQGPDEHLEVVTLLHARKLLAEPLLNYQVGHFVYWLLVSPKGPSHMVSLTPRAERELRDYFRSYGMGFAQRYLEESKFRKIYDRRAPNFSITPETKRDFIAIYQAINQEAALFPH